MRQKKFKVGVEENAGKVINVTYDKCKMLSPDVTYEDVLIIDTLLWGHDKIQEYLHKFRNA